MNVEAWQSIVELVTVVDGQEAGWAEARELADRHPHHVGLQRTCIQWLEAADPREADALLDRLIERHPEDAWARRQRAIHALNRGDTAAALPCARLAYELEPTSTSGAVLLAAALEGTSGFESAAMARRAIQLDVDNARAIVLGFGLARRAGYARAFLDEIELELARQTTNGAGLRMWNSLARDTIGDPERIERLRRLAEAAPLAWRASVLHAEELARAERADEALGVAMAASERFPLVAETWSALARVHGALGHEAEQRTALERAVVVQARGSGALRALAAFHRLRGEVDATCLALERALAREPLDFDLHAELTIELLRNERSLAALARAEHALRLFPERDEAWALLAECAETNGTPERTRELARAGTDAHPESARSWTVLARFLDAPEDLDERCGALQRAAQLSRGDHEAIDLLAETLTKADRHDDALAALDAHEGAHGPSPLLQGRRAWVHAARGEYVRAIELAGPLVGARPDYVFGWEILARSHMRLEQWKGCRDAARNLVRESPDSELAHVYLGYAEEGCGDEAAANASYEKALALAPQHAFAGGRVFELALRKSDLVRARATLAAIRPSLDADDSARYELDLACAEGDHPRARELFRAELREQGRTRDHLAALADRLVRCGRARDVREELELATFDAGANPAAGALWILDFTHRRQWLRGLRAGLRVPSPSAAGAHAAHAYVAELVSANRRGLFFGIARERVLARHRTALVQNAWLWGDVGRLLLDDRGARRVVRWLEEWKRDDTQPAVLQNLAVALRCLKRRAEAHAVSVRALELPHDPTTHLHELFLAVDAFLDGDLARCRELHTRAARGKRGAWHEHLFRVLRVVLEVDTAPDPRAAAIARWSEVWAWHQHVSTYELERPLRDASRAALRHLAVHCGGVRGAWIRVLARV
ncbi:MAG: hypothetical protein IPJ77_07690 [Planctomycetes bacterium]|nr:hypothetical protein [Planctomycetota bacterium]